LLRLHYRPGTAAMAPHAALAEIGLDYELALVELDAEERPPAPYLALNPWGTVPTLEDGELVLTESAAIMLHLADGHPEAGLAPALGTRERSELYRWLMFLTNTVQPSFLRWFYPERYTSDVDGYDMVKAVAGEALRGQLDFLDAELADRPWLVGEDRSAADLFLFMLTRWGRNLEPAAWDRPHLRSHWTRLSERPGVRRMLEEQGLELPAFARAS
jgi:glutathione S-transferase